jgi:hypothetical protein
VKSSLLIIGALSLALFGCGQDGPRDYRAAATDLATRENPDFVVTQVKQFTQSNGEPFICGYGLENVHQEHRHPIFLASPSPNSNELSVLAFDLYQEQAFKRLWNEGCHGWDGNDDGNSVVSEK